MVKVKEFEDVYLLNDFLEKNKIVREQLIDIKYAATKLYTHFLLIYEE